MPIPTNTNSLAGRIKTNQAIQVEGSFPYAVVCPMDIPVRCEHQSSRMFGDGLGAAARSTLSTPVQRNAIKRAGRMGIALSHPMCRLRKHKPGTLAAIVAVARLKLSAIVHELVTEVFIGFVQGMTSECLRAEGGNFHMRSCDKILRTPLPPTLDK
jgi:hypothetical protein